MPIKNYLVSYVVVSGQYEFKKDLLLKLRPREKIRTQVHNYFLDYYGTGNVSKKDSTPWNYYSYNGGEVAISHISWQEISESDAEVLNRLHVA